MCRVCNMPVAKLTLEHIALQADPECWDKLTSKVLGIEAEPEPEDEELAENWERNK